LAYNYSDVNRTHQFRANGFSVRCLKDGVSPTVTTTSATSITSTGATTGGNVTSDGGASVTARGVAYGTVQNPTTANSTTFDGTGTGAFSSTLSTLPSTLYYVRAYATNAVGTAYGNEVSFTTSAAAPSFSCGTSTVSDVDNNTYNTVQIGTQCWTQSNLKVSKYRNGDNIPTGLNNNAWQNVTSGAYSIYNNDPVNDGLYGKFYNYYAVTDIRGLCPTGWHVPSDGEWTILENHLGGSSVAGGALKSTATQPTPGGWNSPNTGATNTSGLTALPGGFRDNIGNFYSVAYLGCWWSSSVSSGSFAWLRYLTNDVSFILRNYNYPTTGFSVRCLKDIASPAVSTTSATSIISSGAITGGNVTSDGGASVTARGVAYATARNPTTANSTTRDGTGTGAFTSTLSGLTATTLYYVRAYATNAVGTAYGNEVSFTTLVPQPCPGTPTVTDVDNNTYTTVQIGTQCWTQSNLKVSKYRNGDNIPTGFSNSSWQATTTGAYAIYDNNPVNDGLYGKLYNHYAVTDSRGLCPTGWHVPSDGEWTILENHLGGSSVAGGALKSTATQPTLGGWDTPNTGATNTSGFTALSGGSRSSSGDFLGVKMYGYWWSSSVSSGSIPNAWRRSLNSNNPNAGRLTNFRTNGFSVRCCRD
jgi:uncharacterized protein (TIGR02145 family)